MSVGVSSSMTLGGIEPPHTKCALEEHIRQYKAANPLPDLWNGSAGQTQGSDRMESQGGERIAAGSVQPPVQARTSTA